VADIGGKGPQFLGLSFRLNQHKVCECKLPRC